MRPNRTVEPGTGSEVRTEEIPAVGAGPRHRKPGRSVLPALTGILAGGLVVLALGMVAAQLYSAIHGQAGPGWPVVAAHLAGAVLAVLLQRRADHSSGRPRRLAALGVAGVFVLVVGAFWWAWLWLFWSL
jgi:hypothetical protein